MKKQITVGLLAHVDAGKTTLTESLLYNSGAIRRLGRVDHRDTFLDTDPIERERGITVRAKQARMEGAKASFILLDTPGHADLSAEMERALWVLDYAVLLISAQDGVTGQVQFLWKLLEHYNIPTFLFLNKIDRTDADKEARLAQIREKLSSSCVLMEETALSQLEETVALSRESLLDAYLNGESVATTEHIQTAVRERKLFPVFCGSALKNEGVRELARGMETYMCPAEYPDAFGARIFRISYDEKGGRLAWLKVTGGALQVKQTVSYSQQGEEVQEKINQIRLYSGTGYELLQEAPAGTVCAVTGLSGVRAGQTLGDEPALKAGMVEPVLTYEIDCDPQLQTPAVLAALRRLEEEEPGLHVRISEKTGKISVQVMGQVQAEILKTRMQEEEGIAISFGAQTILYRESVEKTTEGVGHFEPLRHYAEVRLLIEPLEKGSGLVLENRCPGEELEPHWQKLILSHLQERPLTGILTDSELTDVRITLLGGRAHVKHTGTGDFRQAVFRALRQGLMENTSVLLEPWYDFVLTLPEENLGRALYDLDQMGARNEAPVLRDGEYEITGCGPAAALGSYQEVLTVYSSGCGRLGCTFRGYEPCKNAQEVIEKIGYDPLADTENPASSVFCSHGAGVIIPWYKVKEHMHTALSLQERPGDEQAQEQTAGRQTGAKKEDLSFKERGLRSAAAEKELQEIFERTYGAKGERAARPGWRYAKRRQEQFASSGPKHSAKKVPGEEYLLVDGYNIIFAWEDLKELAKGDIGAARDRLMDMLSDFHGGRSGTLILIFDAYKVSGGVEKVLQYHNIYVVYTRESETADQYIEKTVHRLGKDHRVTVATSDGLEQMIILGEGATRLSAAGLLEEIKEGRRALMEEFRAAKIEERSYLLDNVSKEMRAALQSINEDAPEDSGE